jgi:hypothetical protein
MANRWHARRHGWSEQDVSAWEQERAQRTREALTLRRQQSLLAHTRWGRSVSEEGLLKNLRHVPSVKSTSRRHGESCGTIVGFI